MTKYCFLVFFVLVLGCGDTPQVAGTDEVVEVTPPPLEQFTLPDTLPVLPDTVQYTLNGEGYINLTWAHLAEVDFEERYTEEVDTYVPYPIFRPSVQRLAGEQVEIKGYVIPVEETGEESIIVLSANPFSSCFFCGMAGPETIMDVQLKKKFKGRFKQDDILTFRGKLRLNDSDLYYLNYILEEAELVKS